MDIPNLLAPSLRATAIDSESPVYGKILQWNESTEAFLAAPPPGPASGPAETKEESTMETIEEVATGLCRGIVTAILKEKVTGDDLEIGTKLAWDAYLESPPAKCSEELSAMIRSSKNLLRWYIQIFLVQKGIILSSPVSCLKSIPMLELLVCVLEQHTLRTETPDQKLARSIALYLFYATYVVSPTDETTQKALKHLILNQSFPELSLRILTRPCTAALALSLIRNLHNALVTLQGGTRTILSINLNWDPSENTSFESASWMPKEEAKVDFRSICVSIMLWLLSSSDSLFSDDGEDKRGELATEILGAFYAIRVGKELTLENSSKDISKLIVKLLDLSDGNDKRVHQCKVSTVSLLMDSSPAFGEHLYREGVIDSLSNIFETQVSDTVNNTRVDNSAAAALVPVLVVLNKYAAKTPGILNLVKERVFPQDAEDLFQEKARAQRSSTESKNMGPLDAPPDTLRRKLVTLLTWPEGHIKRCTGELIWTLCKSDPTEFVHRVGFGSGLPLLSVKGFASMPVQP